MADDDTQTRSDRPTPHGGAYSIAYWEDSDGHPCPRSKAVKVKIVEYSAKGKAIFRTYSDLNQ